MVTWAYVSAQNYRVRSCQTEPSGDGEVLSSPIAHHKPQGSEYLTLGLGGGSMKRLSGWVLTAGLLFCPAGAWADGPLGEQARGILKTHRAGCHADGKAKGRFGFVLDRDQLVRRLLVVPGRANQSDLLLRIQQNEMPPSSKKERPSQADLKVLQSWIEAGAPAFDPPSLTTKGLSERDVTLEILADLKQLDPRRHRFTRYLTFSHLAFAGRPAK